MAYDPAYLNTASCRSAITYIDGDAGILRYRGYPIEQLAEEATFLETAFLLLEGELPTAEQLHRWEEDVRYHTYVHTNVQKFLEGFRYDAHPMGMLLGAVGALSTFYPDAKDIDDPDGRYLQRVRLMAKLPTIAAYVFRHAHGLPYVLPRNDLDYIGNFVNMTFEIGGRHEPNPVLQRALEILLRPPCRPRAELLDERRPRGRVVARRPVLCGLGGDRGALRPAPRRRQRGGAPDARPDRRRRRTCRASSSR